MQKARLPFRLVCYFANLKVSGNRKALLPATKAERKKKNPKIRGKPLEKLWNGIGMGGIFESHDLFPLTFPLQDVSFVKTHTRIFFV